jgi:hypothetical protein
MVLTQGHIVDAASYSTAALAPYAAYQKHKLQGLGGMRGQQNSLRQNVNELLFHNFELKMQIGSKAPCCSYITAAIVYIFH